MGGIKKSKQSGASLVEYALLLLTIGVVGIYPLLEIGKKSLSSYETLSAELVDENSTGTSAMMLLGEGNEVDGSTHAGSVENTDGSATLVMEGGGSRTTGMTSTMPAPSQPQ